MSEPRWAHNRISYEPMLGQQLYIYTYDVFKANGFKQHLSEKLGIFSIVKTFIIRTHFSYGLVSQKNFVKHLFWWNVKNKNYSVMWYINADVFTINYCKFSMF